MKKYIVILMLFIPVLFSMIGCERDLMGYEGENSIYFDVRHGVAHIDSSLWARYYHTPINFFGAADSIEVKLRIATAGQVVNYDRPFSIEFLPDSSTAEIGVDFNFNADGVIPAGEAEGFIYMMLYNHEYLLDTNRTAMFQIKSNEHFTTRLNFDEDLSGRYTLSDDEKKYNPDPRFHTVEMRMEVPKPAGTWWVNGLGVYSTQKYLLMLEVLEMTEKDFTNITTAKAGAMGEKFAKYLIAQFDKGEPALEKDGSLMWVPAVGTRWKQGQTEW